jgi:hypothetical protein
MESTITSGRRLFRRFTPILIAGLTLGAGVAAADDNRISVSTEGPAAIRGGAVAEAITRHEFGALRTDGARGGNAGAKATSKPAGAASAAPNVDFWFYTADIELFNDHDADGYYYGIDVLFDADTYFDVADVYAVLYLSLDGGPWNEYAATQDFTIAGATSDDEYVIVTELLSGYPSGSYDVLIELFDAYDGTFLADIGPEDTSELAFLPIEDAGRDAPADVPDVVIVHQHGGGAAGGLWLLAMFAAAAARFRGVRSA